MPTLQNGDLLPSFCVDTIDDGRAAGAIRYRPALSWIVVPLLQRTTRGLRPCPGQLDELGIRVVATSVDDADTTRATAERRRIGFPLGYGADAKALAELTGAYLGGQGRYLESTGFVLDPQGRIITAVYSSNAIGRLLPDDVIGLVKYLRQAA